MSDLGIIMERLESDEFAALVQQAEQNLWAVITATLNDDHGTRSADGTFVYDDDWDQFYLPALRYRVLRRLSRRCIATAAGWHESICNSVREAERSHGD